MTITACGPYSGSRGYVSTWGDGLTWMMVINSVAPRRWTFIKQNLAAFPGLAQVTQDGDGEGVIRLMRLPTRRMRPPKSGTLPG